MKTCTYCENPPTGVIISPGPTGKPTLVCVEFPVMNREPISRYFYRCRHCDELELKEKWGPGRVTCPSCGRLAPSAAESRDFQWERLGDGRIFCDQPCQSYHKEGKHLLGGGP